MANSSLTLTLMMTFKKLIVGAVWLLLFNLHCNILFTFCEVNVENACVECCYPIKSNKAVPSRHKAWISSTTLSILESHFSPPLPTRLRRWIWKIACGCKLETRFLFQCRFSIRHFIQYSRFEMFKCLEMSEWPPTLLNDLIPRICTIMELIQWSRNRELELDCKCQCKEWTPQNRLNPAPNPDNPAWFWVGGRAGRGLRRSDSGWRGVWGYG